MTLVKMKHTRYGSQDGFTVDRFYSGEMYHLSDSLAWQFINGNAAELVTVDTYENGEAI